MTNVQKSIFKPL